MRGVGQATAHGCRVGLELIRERGCLCRETCERKERGGQAKEREGKMERGATCGHSQGPVETVTSETFCNLQLLRHRPQPSKWVGNKPSGHACAKNETRFLTVTVGRCHYPPLTNTNLRCTAQPLSSINPPPKSSDRNAMYYNGLASAKGRRKSKYKSMGCHYWQHASETWRIPRPCSSQSSHLDHLGAVRHALQALSIYNAILFASKEFVPPTKEEVAGDKLEPRRE